MCPLTSSWRMRRGGATRLRRGPTMRARLLRVHRDEHARELARRRLRRVRAEAHSPAPVAVRSIPQLVAAPLRRNPTAARLVGPSRRPSGQNPQRFRSGTRDSNPRHPAWEAGTLPTELVPQSDAVRIVRLVACQSSSARDVERSGKRNGPGTPRVGVSRAVPLSVLRPILRGAEGACFFGSRSVGPLSSGAATRCRGDAGTSAGAATNVRSSQRTSLRTRSRMRATTFMHFAVPPPVVPAPAGPADRAAASRGRFQLGGRSAVEQRDPGPCCACGGDPPPDQSGTMCPSAACHQSLTPKIECNRGAPTNLRAHCRSVAHGLSGTRARL